MKISLFVCVAALLLFGCSKAPEAGPVSWRYVQTEWDNNYSSVNVEVMGSVSNDTFTCQSSAELLDALGQRHWELAAVNSGPGGSEFWFKRPVDLGSEKYLFDP